MSAAWDTGMVRVRLAYAAWNKFNIQCWDVLESSPDLNARDIELHTALTDAWAAQCLIPAPDHKALGWKRMHSVVFPDQLNVALAMRLDEVRLLAPEGIAA